MRRTGSWMALLSVLCLAGTVFVGLVAQAQEPQGSDYHYYYFDEAKPLALDTARVAVFQKQGAKEVWQTKLTRDGLPAYGIAAEDIEPFPIMGVSLAKTPATVRGGVSVEGLVADMAREPDLEGVSPVFLDRFGNPVIVLRHLHVGFHDDVSAERAEAILSERVDGVIEARNWSRMPGVYRLKCASKNGLEVLALANSLVELPEIKFASPDMIMTTRKHLIPDDTYFSVLWGLHNTGQSGGTADMDIDAPEAWDITTGSANIVVVVLDDGVQQDHPDINQRSGADFSGHGTSGGPHNSCDDHGTTVAGCISAIINNGTDVVGAAPNCLVASAKTSISNEPCDGMGFYISSWVVNALEWAETIGARVTNASGALMPDSTITSKYNSTRNAGIIHFAATGNDGSSSITYPANLPTVSAVGAINRYGNRASFSTYGTGLDFMAPGEEILTTDRTGGDGFVGGDTVTADGTSLASPYAAAIAALVLSRDDSLTPDELKTVLEDTCKDRGSSGYDTYYGWGILQAFAAVDSVGGAECGNDACEYGEDCINCPEDCGDCCGNGTCDHGEDCVTCPADCGECTYCVAGSEHGGAECGEHITGVQVGSINNTGTDCGEDGYSNYMALSTTMQLSTGYPITVTNGDPYANDQCAIWVDWNQDLDFDDAEETISVSDTPGVGPYTATITPPAWSTLGETGLRVRVRYTGVLEPCGTTFWGEVEDYTINVVNENSDAELIESFPEHEQTLWRTANNFIRLTFDADIIVPANGELLIEVMNSNGAFGTSYTTGTNGTADFHVEVTTNGSGDLRVLDIWENGSVLTHTDWIAVHNTGSWNGVAEFHRHYLVMKGDVDGDGDVLPTDFGPMFPKIPTFGSAPEERADVDGNRDVLPTDFGPMFPQIPTFGMHYPKPGGHLP